MKLLIFNSDYLHKILIISHHNSFASNNIGSPIMFVRSIEDCEEWKLVKKFILVQDILYPSPEWTPPNVALAEVLVAGCLRDESLHLLRHLEALLCIKIFPRQFVSDPLHNIQRELVEDLRFN